MDLVISAAGILTAQDVLDRDPLTAGRLVETNFTGHVTALLAAAGRMRAQGHGTIVVLSSVAAIRPRKANFVYGSAKAGLDAFARGLADALHGTGVGVLLVRPGFVIGRMTAGMPPAPLSSTPAQVGRGGGPRRSAGRPRPAPCGCRPRWPCWPRRSGCCRGRCGAGCHAELSGPVMRVLVAEDDRGLRDALGRGLREHGYTVDTVPDGQTAMTYLRSYEYEVVVLDWRMPGVSGLDVLQWLRHGAQPVPVLMLTARDAPADRVTGLDQGADDYLVKPFDFAELLARIRALQRRPRTAQPPQLVIGDVVFDPATREVRIGAQRPSLTSTERGILEMLMRRSPAVVDRRSIALSVWDNEADALGSNTIDVHMARLRAKLAAGQVRIESVRAVGYRIVAR